MAEALVIVGLVSNILSFIDFGAKLFTVSQGIRDSRHGQAMEVRELEVIVADVESSITQVKAWRSTGQPLSQDERKLLDLVDDYEELARWIQQVLKKMRRRQSPTSQRYEDLRIAFQAMMRKKDLELYHRKLENFEQKIQGRLQLILLSERHSATAAQLDKIETMQRKSEINYDIKLSNVRNEIMQLIQQGQADADSLVASRAAQISKLRVLQLKHSAYSQQIPIISSLYVPVLSKRWSEIPTADQSSNDWLFRPEPTSYTAWLEHGAGVFLIDGKAGSGKSTLMKFASSHATTIQLLEKWAYPLKLHTASFYFWNQGFELQKSQKGLFQSLLYQILRSTPLLAQRIPKPMHKHETWEMQDLQAAFEEVLRISLDSSLHHLEGLNAKFCFFIDGLDEYNGTEEEVVTMLNFLTRFPNIKICVSSRTRAIFKRDIQELQHIIIISDYTKDDMTRYVRQKLLENVKFQKLQASHPACEKIVEDIAQYAHGVWLWVFLVTRDLVHAVNRDEGVEKLQEITDDFPRGLDEYFKRMIEEIKPSYQADMARIFLIAIDELQPLPLFAFSLLDHEQRNADYALQAPCQSIDYKDYEGLKSRIQNRCGDLMVVEDGPHPIFLDQPVDFLHRTVRDYLRNHYRQQLRARLDAEFDPMLSLCRFQLYLLKSVGDVDLRDQVTINQVIGLTDELLYYAYEVERKTEYGAVSPATPVLDQLDEVNTHYANRSLIKKHWTHIRDSPSGRGLDQYDEGEYCNFLALAVQARLVKYVRAKLEEDPSRILKRGRPLLDYALRPLRRTPIAMPYHSQEDDPSVNIQMVRLLLDFDTKKKDTICRPIHLLEDRSVWELFLVSCYEATKHTTGATNRKSIAVSLREAWYTACSELIHAGAPSENSSITGAKNLFVEDIIDQVFKERAPVLIMSMIEKSKVSNRSSCSLM